MTKLMENRFLVYVLQLLSVVFIALSNIDVILKVALVLSYVMLFRMKKWQKHIPIMLIMLLILLVGSHQQ